MRTLRFFAASIALACAPAPKDDATMRSDTGLGPTSGTLKVLSYNVHGLPALITGDDTPGRMAQIAPLLKEWDLVGLQEDWMDENHAVLTGETDHITKLWFDETLNGDRYYGSGLSVLANHPVITVQNTHYTTCNGVLDGASDCLASKGLQVVRLRVGAAEIDMYNTHFEAGGSPEDNLARSDQVSDVIASLNDFSDGRAVIFTGDFNLRESDPEDRPELERLTSEGGLSDVCESLDCAEPDHIDRVFIRSSHGVLLNAEAWANKSADFLDNDGMPLSDHPPILADVGFEVVD